MSRDAVPQISAKRVGLLRSLGSFELQAVDVVGFGRVVRSDPAPDLPQVVSDPVGMPPHAIR